MITPAPSSGNVDTTTRRGVMATLARAKAHELSEPLAVIADIPDCEDLRPAQIGLVMLRGRVGGSGAPFNLGEATVTRAAVRLESGQVGYSYLLGRQPETAKLAAICDALWQHPAFRERVEARVLSPIRARLEEEGALQRARTAATKVEFFTMLRGED